MAACAFYPSAFGALAPQNLRVGSQHHRPPVSGALTPQKLRVGSRRHRPPIALVDTKIAAWDDYSTTEDGLVLGLPTIADLPDVASLLGECFFRTADGEYCDWRTLAFSFVAPIACLFVFAFLIPETPRWYMNRGDVDRAQRSLRRLRRVERRNRRRVVPAVDVDRGLAEGRRGS